MGFGLVDERLIQENGRFYEIIHVAKNRKTPLCNVGSKMWQESKVQGRLYLNQTLAHYERKAQKKAEDAAAIFAAYTVLRDELGLVSGLGIEETHNVL